MRTTIDEGLEAPGREVLGRYRSPSGPLRPTAGAPAPAEAFYRAYRRRQALHFMHLLPPDGVRALYRAARAEAVDHPREGDPLSLALAYVERRLPLPPFEVWLRDRTEHPIPHLEEEGDGVGPEGEAGEPMEVRTRTLRQGDGVWVATLVVRSGEGAWRGSIRFEAAESQRDVTTAEIFREARPSEIVSRFEAFREETLAAFLRSVLP